MTATKEKLRCLSIRQPHAEDIMTGLKWVENRSWPTKVRGTIGIHASGKSKDHPTQVIVGTVDIVDCLTAEQAIDIAYCMCKLPEFAVDMEILEKFPHVSECMKNRFDYNMARRMYDDEEIRFDGDEWSPKADPLWCVSGEWCFVLANPVRFTNPEPAKGKLGFWFF